MSAERGAGAIRSRPTGATSRHTDSSWRAKAGGGRRHDRRHPRLAGHVKAGGHAGSTQARRLSAVRQFHRFLYGEGIAAADPAAIIEAPRGAAVAEDPEPGRGRPAARHRARAPRAAAGPARLRALRLYCLIELLYATGLRVSELVALPLTAATTRDRFLIIRGKGGRERLVPLSEPSRQAMADYLAAVRAAGRAPQGRDGRPMAVLHPRRQRPPDAPALRGGAEGLAAAAGLDPRRSRRTCCATPSPATCWPGAPTCAPCSNCWAMPTSPRPRSTPMSCRSACTTSSRATTRSPAVRLGETPRQLTDTRRTATFPAVPEPLTLSFPGCACTPISISKARSPSSKPRSPSSRRSAPTIRPWRSTRKCASSRARPPRAWPSSTPSSTPGRRRRSPAIRTGRTTWTTPAPCSPASRRSPATASSATTSSILGGPAWFGDEPVMLIGQEKGHDTQARIAHNFGMARPEGYRKAVRLMEMAERFGLPVISFIDTPGAYPGIGAEERGQSEAIARSIDCCLGLTVPTIAVIIGEGGSGGAVAIATANRVLMLEHAIYSVISPEGAASILWRDSNKAEDAAVALKITAADLQAAQGHRRDHPRAGGRGAPRPRAHDGRDRRGHRRQARNAEGPRPGRDSPAAARENSWRSAGRFRRGRPMASSVFCSLSEYQLQADADLRHQHQDGDRDDRSDQAVFDRRDRAVVVHIVVSLLDA
jgi:integrase